ATGRGSRRNLSRRRFFASRPKSRYGSAGSDSRAFGPAVDRSGVGSGNDHFAKACSWVTIKPKYVNMADITVTLPPDRSAPAEDLGARAEQPLWDVIELLFFAYRDFVGDPDEVLEKYGFGRAHHRVLHFVNRNPGMKVADLLVILKITKQSLGRVLKQLID